MSIWNLQEDEPVVRRIRSAAERGALSHALLLTGPGDRESAVRFAAAALECRAAEGRPCGVCPDCRKVLAGIHPDVITVQDPEHKNIAVDVIRQIRADAYIRPNEGARKVYIFPDCSVVTDRDQNVLLKIVEEGPPYAAFLFCAENPAVVLQTLRSRCVELKMQAAQEQEEELSEAALVLCRAITEKRRGAVTEAAIRLERSKTNRDTLARVLADCLTVVSAALLQQYGQEAPDGCREIAAIVSKNLTKAQIMRTIEVLQKYRSECVYNIGPGHVLGALAVELEGIL